MSAATSHWAWPSARGLIRVAGACAVIGIGLSASDYGDLGKWLAIVGVALLVVGLHRFGRMGPDAPLVFDVAVRPLKKKKKKKPTPAAPDASPAAADASKESEEAR